ncbi:hypothetical protein HY990_03815 [Candidatus Micrarchaeota archaeon]|nr:hypothetical protein [Candidatus Micrarchaeota archaeon]
MSVARKIILHGKTHQEDERRNDSCRLAQALSKGNSKGAVKLFYEAHLVDQPLEPQERARFTFPPSPPEHSRLLDLAAALGLLQQLAIYPVFFCQREVRARGAREARILDVLESNFDSDLYRMNWVFSLRRYGHYTDREISDFESQLRSGHYPSFVRPHMKRTIDRTAGLTDLSDLVLQIQTTFAKFELPFEPSILGADWSAMLRELRYAEPKGTMNPILLYAMALDLYLKLDYVREGFIASTMLSTDFDVGILNIGIAHVWRGRIETWLRQSGIEVEKDSKTIALLSEYGPNALTDAAEEAELFTILRS